MKFIVVCWVKEDTFGYGKAMRVVASTHPRFTVGSRFDFGFMSIATDEGYTITSYPLINSRPNLKAGVRLTGVKRTNKK